MVEEEVENILREIRERVRAQELPGSVISNSAMGNGGESPLTSREAVETSAAEALARIDSYLATTSRAWDRLPPLMTYRDGGMARFELWVKRQIKRATHWFTWEQINFNAAVHHALKDMLEAQRTAQSNYSRALEKLGAEIGLQSEAQRVTQSNHEQALEKLRAEMKRQVEAQRGAQSNYEQALEKLRAEIKGQVEAQRAAQTSYDQSLEKLRAEMNSQIEAEREMKVQVETQVVAQSKEVVARGKEMDQRLSSLTLELEARFERIQDEQRVCFKQLSLEATEAAVLEDRTRRKAETLLEELQRRIEQMEKKRRVAK